MAQYGQYTDEEALDIAKQFVDACPIGWGIDSGYEEMEKTGPATWHMRNEDGEEWDGGTTDAALFLLNEQGFLNDIDELKDRLATGQMGGGL